MARVFTTELWAYHGFCVTIHVLFDLRCFVCDVYMRSDCGKGYSLAIYYVNCSSVTLYASKPDPPKVRKTRQCSYLALFAALVLLKVHLLKLCLQLKTAPSVYLLLLCKGAFLSCAIDQNVRREPQRNNHRTTPKASTYDCCGVPLKSGVR